MTINAGCDQKDRLVGYLYDEVTDEERHAVEAHLATCAGCRREVDDLRGVRLHLSSWSPPEPELGFLIVREPARARRVWWRQPAWGVALAAAAVLVLAAAAAVANLEVRYDAQGVTVRTGWSAPAPSAAPAVTPSSVTAMATPVANAADARPWQTELAALETRLRADLAARPAAAAAAPDEASVLRRVSALVAESETRQQRELALRLTQLVRDTDQQRRADWARIAQGFGRLEDLTGAGAAQQREMMNYLMRVSQQRET
jgi:hypothetical protein